MTAKKIVLIASIFTLVRIAAAAILPIMRDEAYYTIWAQHLDFGYLDHPPMVALTTLGTLLAESSAFSTRLGSLALAVAGIFLFIRLCRRSGLTEQATLITALALGQGSLAAIVSGFLATPDAALAFAWILALHESHAALEKDPRRWVSAGFAVGIGLLAKYHMILMVGIFLWTLWHHRRTDLKTTWPWAGVFMALLVFSPNLIWNASNEFLTVKFQLAHGFGQDRSTLVRGILPEAIGDQDGSTEELLARTFAQADTETPIKKPKKKKKLKSLPERLYIRITDFVGGQLGLWGALLIPCTIALWRRKNAEKSWRASLVTPLRQSFSPATLSLLGAATFIPLVFFGVISLGGKIEANWPAMYLISASICLSVLCGRAPHRFFGFAALNMVLVLAGALHARTGLVSAGGEDDRLLNEAAGYPELAGHLQTSPQPLFADTFQNMAVLKFLAPSLDIAQWPGITRPSEFTRSADYYAPDTPLKVKRGFRLITDDSIPPRIPGYFSAELVELRHCPGQPLDVVTRDDFVNGTVDCKRPRRIWRQIDYAAYPKL